MQLSAPIAGYGTPVQRLGRSRTLPDRRLKFTPEEANGIQIFISHSLFLARTQELGLT